MIDCNMSMSQERMNVSVDCTLPRYACVRQQQWNTAMRPKWNIHKKTLISQPSIVALPNYLGVLSSFTPQLPLISGRYLFVMLCTTLLTTAGPAYIPFNVLLLIFIHSPKLFMNNPKITSSSHCHRRRRDHQKTFRAPCYKSFIHSYTWCARALHIQSRQFSLLHGWPVSTSIYLSTTSGGQSIMLQYTHLRGLRYKFSASIVDLIEVTLNPLEPTGITLRMLRCPWASYARELRLNLLREF